MVCCLSVLSRGSIEAKLHLCFDIFDQDNSGTLDTGELQNLVSAIVRPIYDRMKSIGGYLPANLKVAHVRQCFAQISDAHGGIVAFPDFFYAVIQNSFVLNLFIDQFDMEIDD
jgi:Ca2+-binding EF-hand superfamily protein